MLDVNIPNLRKTLEMMADDPRLVDMRGWVDVRPCGTTACLAGHAVTLVGDWVMNEGCDGATLVQVGDLQTPIESIAAEVLGFTTCAMVDAFFLRTSGLMGRDAVAVLYKMAEVVTEGAITMPPEFEDDYRGVGESLLVDPAEHYLRYVS